MTPLLELRNVTKIYKHGLISRRQTVALDNVSLTIDDATPSIITVAGESGSGKTTMSLLALGFIEPTFGEVLYRGRNISKLRKAEYMQFRRDVQAVFQDPFAVFNPFYKVDHLLTVPISKFKLARSRAEARQMMEEALSAVGLRPEEILGRYPHQLSGGQRQRISVARALLLRPKLLVADEPVSMVDASLRATILESLQKLKRDYGVSILYITHDLTTAYHISDYILILYRGSVMEAGDVDTVISNPKHPYTQLLIDSIPWPDIDMQWGAHNIQAREGEDDVTEGCCFASRCPFVMDRCRASRPPLFKLAPTRVAACFLFEEHPRLENEPLSSLFKQPEATHTS
ncbi:MAG: ABC transporter ATP-binding protein [Thermoflexales bacterium]|nr:ABC transporter ATP-binding protein [Thermoflexales bacterium]MDW8352353.1 ABC transporter ATP-binding protein [Anaerolineae bacterium]